MKWRKNEVFKPPASCSAWELCYLGLWTFWHSTQNREGKCRYFSPRAGQRALIRFSTESATKTWERSRALSVRHSEMGEPGHRADKEDPGEDAGFSTSTNWLCILFPSLDEESVLPLLAQDSNSKARRGILRRAVFSEDQRKALEKMFQKQKYISKIDRKKLAINLGLKESQVLRSRNSFWFLNEYDGSHPFGKCLLYQAGPWALLRWFS